MLVPGIANVQEERWDDTPASGPKTQATRRRLTMKVGAASSKLYAPRCARLKRPGTTKASVSMP
eukprot:808281-Rhodomonas_salina.1